MGLQFFDQYMYLHFAVGIVIYYWGISLKNWIIVHSLFELLELYDVNLMILIVGEPNIVHGKLTWCDKTNWMQWPPHKPVLHA